MPVDNALSGYVQGTFSHYLLTGAILHSREAFDALRMNRQGDAIRHARHAAQLDEQVLLWGAPLHLDALVDAHRFFAVQFSSRQQRDLQYQSSAASRAGNIVTVAELAAPAEDTAAMKKRAQALYEYIGKVFTRHGLFENSRPNYESRLLQAVTKARKEILELEILLAAIADEEPEAMAGYSGQDPSFFTTYSRRLSGILSDAERSGLIRPDDDGKKDFGAPSV